MIVPDANILLYAYDSRSEKHGPAREWLETVLRTEDVGFGWQTLTAFLRISTDRRVFTAPYTLSETFYIIRNWLSAPRAHLLVPTEGHLPIFQKLAVTAAASGPLLMDAHLAALAIEHGATLATNDRDFRRFDGLKLLDPLANR